jgi:hypothetical protein
VYAKSDDSVAILAPRILAAQSLCAGRLQWKYDPASGLQSCNNTSGCGWNNGQCVSGGGDDGKKIIADNSATEDYCHNTFQVRPDRCIGWSNNQCDWINGACHAKGSKGTPTPIVTPNVRQKSGLASVDMKLTAKMLVPVPPNTFGIKYTETKNREISDGPFFFVPDIHEAINISWTSSNTIFCTKSSLGQPYGETVATQNTNGLEYSAPKVQLNNYNEYSIAISCIGADGSTVTDKIRVIAPNGAGDIDFNTQKTAEVYSISADGIVTGWATSKADPAVPQAKLFVSFYGNNKPFGDTMALPFGDKVWIGEANANLPNIHGNSGFSFKIPAMYKDGQTRYLGIIVKVDTRSGIGVGEQFGIDLPYR